ncbi:MAG: 4'-phosphopantetheinyl transferase superfamily protein [Xanthomonadales bacterium]|nr:4'-phosphopantetheinyl transferase superfamily protein [Xanthomonadales bacterium]
MNIVSHQYQASSLARQKISSTQQVHCWFYPLDQAQFWPDLASRNTLSVHERNKSESFYREDLKTHYRQAHLGKRYILSRYLQHAAHELQFIDQQYGKPELSKNTNIDNYHFNLSHSHGWACLAIANTAVGVDVEYINPASQWQELCRMVCHSSDQIHDAEAFYQTWSGKEAASKWDGRGLGIEFTQLSLTPLTRSHPNAYKALHDKEKDFQCWVYSIVNHYGLAAALASAERLLQIDCFYPVLADSSSHHAQSKTNPVNS